LIGLAFGCLNSRFADDVRRSARTLQPIWLTLRLALLTTVALFIIGMPLAHWLNVSRWRGVLIVETVVTLPIVLPPTVIGFYLLVLFAPQNPLGKLWIALTAHTLAFSFSGLLVGSIIYSLPFAVQPFQAALKAVPHTLIEVARISGANFLQVFWYVTPSHCAARYRRGNRVKFRTYHR
jgi:molybdate transport system permease protein